MKIKLLKIIGETKPDKLIVLGDAKHSVPTIVHQEWNDLFALFEALLKHVKDIAIVPGNHDGDIQMFVPRQIKILPSQGIIVGKKQKVALLHGHTWPLPEAFRADYIVIGHSHPVIHIIDNFGFRIVKQVWVKFNCNTIELAKSYLKYLGTRTDDPLRVMRNKFGIPLGNPKIILMPSFNEALGGLPLNMGNSGLLGPLFRSRGVDIGTGEIHLLDGAYLGTVEQLRTLQK
jgi:metallophosphoesterase superfamily enzyme